MQTVDDIVTNTLDTNYITFCSETVYKTTSYNGANIPEVIDFSSYLQQESNITSYSQDINYSMEFEDNRVNVEEVNENIPNPQESNHVSSILQDEIDRYFNEVENTYNTQDQNYHYPSFSFDEMEEVSSNLFL